MENNSDNHEIRGKTIRTIILLIVLMIPVSLVLLSITNYFDNKRTLVQEQISADALAKLNEYMDSEEEAAKTQFDEHLSAEVELTAELLKDSVTQDGYTGPRVLSNGFVAELKGENVLIPEGVADGKTQLTRTLIEESIAAGTMRACTIDAASEAGREEEGEEALAKGYHLSFGRITDTLVYVEMTPVAEYEGYLALYTTESRKAIEASEGFFNSKERETWIRDTYVRETTIIFLMFLILITLSVYILSEQRYARENILTGDDLDKHDPSKIKRKMVSATTAGAIAILIITFLTQTVGDMYQQTRYGRDMLQLIAAKYTDKANEKQSEAIQSAQEDWYVRYGLEIAEYLEDRSEGVTKENLLRLSEILGTDFITVFDSEGNEIISSGKYESLTLDRGLGANSSDFRRLLIGIPSIVHNVSEDTVTGLERQMIGVSMKAVDDPAEYGALILALMPDQITDSTDLDNVIDESTLLVEGNVLCFIADSAAGVIRFSGDKGMVGKTVSECGLTDKSLLDGYMDYGTVNGTNRFIVTVKSGNNILYYSINYRDLRNENLILSVAAVAVYLLAAVILGFWLMSGYSKRKFKEWAARKIPFTGKADAVLNRLFTWEKRTPESKAGLIFYAGLFVMMQMWVKLILGHEIASNQYSSMLDYLLWGDWMRGFNLFALCCILLILAIANLVITLSGWGLHLLAGFLSAKGETICMLFRSVIKYVTIFAVILLSLGCLGLMSPTVIASLGIGSLALSLGAKDVVTDILAGIFIVFEETLRVGDVIQYNGACYTVEEVGMRSTKLSIPPGNHLILSNHELSSVTNMSKEDSIAYIYVSIIANQSLTSIEELLNKEFPEITKKSDKLKGPVKYYGVSQLGFGDKNYKQLPVMTLCIGAACDQKDMWMVGMFLNREFRLLAEREGIEVI